MPREPPVMRTERAIAQRPRADLAPSTAELSIFPPRDRLGRDRPSYFMPTDGTASEIGAFSTLWQHLERPAVAKEHLGFVMHGLDPCIQAAPSMIIKRTSAPWMHGSSPCIQGLATAAPNANRRLLLIYTIASPASGYDSSRSPAAISPATTGKAGRALSRAYHSRSARWCDKDGPGTPRHCERCEAIHLSTRCSANDVPKPGV